MRRIIQPITDYNAFFSSLKKESETKPRGKAPDVPPKRSVKQPASGRATRWLNTGILIIIVLLPLIVLPGISKPFSTPKTLLLEAFVLVAGICAIIFGALKPLFLPAFFRLALAVWIMALSCSAFFGDFVSPQSVALPLAAVGWFLLIVSLRPEAGHMAAGISAACFIIAVIALLQYTGLDPLSLFGSPLRAADSRMRIVGTLGNPNFTAALLASGVPVTLALGKLSGRYAISCGIVCIEIFAILATGSKAGVFAVLASVLAIAWLIRLDNRLWLAAGAVIVIILSTFMPSRPLHTAMEGRFYIWKVAAPHMLERPLFGFGPGAFEPKYIEWETGYWQKSLGSEDERKFAQLQEHAHNDYLETLVNQGLAGFLGLVASMFSFFILAFRQASAKNNIIAAGAASGAAALALVSTVDFPMQRPAELFYFWTLIAITFLTCLRQKDAPKGI